MNLNIYELRIKFKSALANLHILLINYNGYFTFIRSSIEINKH